MVEPPLIGGFTMTPIPSQQSEQVDDNSSDSPPTATLHRVAAGTAATTGYADENRPVNIPDNSSDSTIKVGDMKGRHATKRLEQYLRGQAGAEEWRAVLQDVDAELEVRCLCKTFVSRPFCVGTMRTGNNFSLYVVV